MDTRILGQAYLAYLGRPPDAAGTAAFAGSSESAVVAALSNSAESQVFFASASAAARLDAVYLNLFGRVAEAEGIAHWLNEISSGRITLEELPLAVLRGARNADAQAVANKLQVAESFVSELASRDASQAFAGSAVAASARGFLSHVGPSEASLSQALADVSTAVNVAVSHQDATKTAKTWSMSVADGVMFQATPSASTFASSSTTQTAGLDSFKADTRFAGITGRGQTVVVIDSSFDLDHPAFGPDADRNGVADRILFSADFTPERNGANTIDTANDKHGTHVASLVASQLTNAPGMAPGANLILLQALEEKGSGSSNDIQQALDWVARNASMYNIAAVNMSLGADSNDNTHVVTPYGDEFAALSRIGIVVLVAAGNSYEDYQAEGVGSPASDPGALAVSASNNSKSVLASFSQRSGGLTDIVAPGQGILGADAGGNLLSLSGTSMATPIASGAVALAQELALQTLGRRLTVTEVYTVLQSSASTFVDREIASDGVRNSGATFRHLDIKAMGEAVVALGSGAPASTPSPAPAPSPVAAPAPSPTPAPADDFGNSQQTAGRINAGQSIAGTLEAVGDRDWFAVDLTAGSVYDIALTGGSGSGSLQDPYLRVLDTNGSVVAENDDRSGLNSGLTLLAPATGRFFLVADSYLTSLTGAYTLTVSGGVAGNVGDSTDVDGSDSTRSGQVEFGGERDSFNVSLSAGTRYTFSLRGSDSGVGTLKDPFLSLLQAGSVVAENDNGGVGLDAELNFTPSVSGSFSVQASSASADETGTYRLQISSAANAPTDVPDTSASQVGLGSGASVQGAIDFGGDKDWYRVNLQVGNAYAFSLSGLSDGLATLYDANGRFVAADDNGGSNGRDALLRFTPSSSGTFFVAASAVSDRETGSFVLRMDVEAARTTGPANARQAGSLTVGSPVDGVLASKDGFDVYTGALAPGRYRVTVGSASGTDRLNDPFVYVDSDSNFLDGLYNDDAGTSLNAGLTFSVLSNTTGVIAVGGFDSGSYTLLLQTV